MHSFLDLNIVDGTVVLFFVLLSVGLLGYLTLRRPSRAIPGGHRPSRTPAVRRWVITALIGIGSGALLAGVILFLCEVVFNVFGLPLDWDTRAWVGGAFAGIGLAVANFWESRWWRKVVAVVGMAVFAATAALGINAGYGLNPTLASFLNVQVAQPVALPKPVHTTPPVVPPKPLWETWKAPVDMPSAGSFGTVTIPAPASGFVARPAYLYLPPAALVHNPPALPVMIMMMGQPGGPESSALFLPTLNALAAAHHGLAPIVLTIDQIGSPTKNPLCIDSPAGHVATYVMTDVVNYIRSTLHVVPGRLGWAIAGYSNGGECALSFGAQHPEIFGSILDVSGEIGPSLGSVSTTIRLGFGGNTAAYVAAQPLTILKAHHYDDTLAIFTNGSADPVYGPEVTTAEAAAQAAGMTTVRFVGAGIGHRADAVTFGVPKGLPVLFPRWSLAPPG
jgi:poly(3-hydroxybutyrate) depolymerase